MDEIEIKKVVETLLFISDQPLPLERISQIISLKENKIQKAIDMLEEDYKDRTFQIMNIAGGYQMATRQEYSLWIRRLYNNRMTVRLSAAALETLSIIAYKQPITRADVEVIRGVEVIGPLETLLERRLITTVGRKESVGRPLLYGTTKEFLRQFGLNSLDNLPDINTLVDKDASDTPVQTVLGQPSLKEESMDGLSSDIEQVTDENSGAKVVEEDNTVAKTENNPLEVEKEEEKVSSQDEAIEDVVEEDSSSSVNFDNKIDEAIAGIQEKKADIPDEENISSENESSSGEELMGENPSTSEEAMDDKPPVAEQAMDDKPPVAEQAMDDKPADNVDASADEDKE
jgi:segregation and condensation protein B